MLLPIAGKSQRSHRKAGRTIKRSAPADYVRCAGGARWCEARRLQARVTLTGQSTLWAPWPEKPRIATGEKCPFYRGFLRNHPEITALNYTDSTLGGVRESAPNRAKTGIW